MNTTNKKERPILFQTEMVQAIIDDRKNQTRRVVKSKTGWFHVETAKFEPNVYGYYHNRRIEEADDDECSTGRTILCPYGEPGDILWVRESFVFRDKYERYYFKADHSKPFAEPYAHNGWKPSIHMPKNAARIWLEITDVRAERVQDISEEDAIAEGVYGITTMHPTSNRMKFHMLWDRINGPDSWAHSWVWVIVFKVLSTTGRPAQPFSKN